MMVPTSRPSPCARRTLRGGVALALAMTLLAGPANHAGAQETKTLDEFVDGMTPMEGFFDLYWDDGEGKLYWAIDRWEEEFLHQVSLPTGLGSNPVGLDRGQLGGTYVLKARRVGPRVLLIEPNYGYRASSEDAAERAAVEQAFAPSTRWGFTVAAEGEDGEVLVDATDFFLRDAHGVIRTLDNTGQGRYQLDRSRSVVHLPRTAAFPMNTEVEVALTFTADEPGRLVSRTAASGDAFTVRQHHSLVQLPDEGYEPREADPRVGAFGIYFQDYATPIDQPVGQRWVARHRLAKRDPSQPMSEPVEPIVYYLDPGVPEPIRSALLEGGNWWNQAFEAAGYIDAFRVEMLPEGADPMDLRYNMIHWTHRRTRGWSYGSNVTDPRTGEILKGNVNLGSLRLRQDHMIGVGLGFPPATGASGTGASGAPGSDGARSNPLAATPVTRFEASGWRIPAIRDPGPGSRGGVESCEASAGPGFEYLAAVARAGDPTEMALARIRQLSAHEIGHTLGLAHNFIASAYGRASVMDYPAPTVRLGSDGEIDLTDAYDVGIGEYDAFAITWLYGDFPEGREAAALDSIVTDGLERGMRFISDGDARPAGAAHPLAHLWDNGTDPVATLEDEIAIRAAGLGSFGPALLRDGEPLSNLHGLFVPLYLHHRYQVEAALRSVGGVDYNYAVKGDGQRIVEPVGPARQRAALETVLATVTPDFLAVDEPVLQMIPPDAFASLPQETFAGGSGPTFDPMAVASAAADFTIGLLLHPARVSRLVEQNARQPALPGADEVLDRVVEATWRQAPAAALDARVAEIVQAVVLDRLFEGASLEASAAPVRTAFWSALGRLESWLAERPSATAYQRMALEEIGRWRQRTDEAGNLVEPDGLPPGSPIGSGRRP